jgi:hypothetical protein
LQEGATIDNFLEPELSHSAKQNESARQPAVPTAYNAPAQR